MAATAEWPPCTRTTAAPIASRYELGGVPDGHTTALRHLAATNRPGVLDMFAVTVFSSDGRSIKPSPAPFDQVLAGLAVVPASVVVAGDSLQCDVGGGDGRRAGFG